MQAGSNKLLSFSGRASRSEYWWYVVPILVLLSAAFAFDLIVVGPETFQRVSITTDLVTGEKTQEVSIVTHYGPRIGTFVVSLLVLVPFASMLTRRVHDIGYPGWYAWVALFLAFFFGPGLSYFAGLVGVISIPVALVVAVLIGVPQAILSVLALVVIFLWGTTPSEPGDNEYGPEPSEAKA